MIVALLGDDPSHPLAHFRAALTAYLHQPDLPDDIASVVRLLGADAVVDAVVGHTLRRALAADRAVLTQVRGYYPDLAPPPAQAHPH